MRSLTTQITFSLLVCLFLFTSCEKDKSFDELTPYRTYTALLNQHDQDTPVATVLQNSLNLNITWSRISRGKYVGSLSKAVNIEKSILLFTTPTTHSQIKGEFSSPNEIIVWAEWGVNAYSDNLTNVAFEIKEYK
jgi:hypothetical protein